MWAAEIEEGSATHDWDVDWSRTADGAVLRIQGRELALRWHKLDEAGGLAMEMQGKRYVVVVVADGEDAHVRLANRTLRVRLHDARREAGSTPGAAVCRAPMPGMLVQLSVEEGSVVRAGDLIAVLESMKMQVDLRAPVDGTIGTIQVAVGATVPRDAVITTIIPAGR